MHKIEIPANNSEVSEAKGLEPGTLIAMDNFNRLNNDAKVIVRPPEGSPPQRGGGGRGGAQRGKKGPS